MRAGRRSTISSSARYSNAAVRRQSPRPSGSAGASWKSESARDCPCRIIPRQIGSLGLSAPMLRKAKARVAERRLGNVNGLAVMDAQHLAFVEAAFDVVVAQYVITAV